MYIPTQEHIDLWKRGCSCQFIANLVGVHRMTICRGFHKMGFDLINRPRPNIEEIVAEVLRLKGLGWSRNKISERVGYSNRQIGRWTNNK